jgi:hypothetical protein
VKPIDPNWTIQNDRQSVTSVLTPAFGYCVNKTWFRR